MIDVDELLLAFAAEAVIPQTDGVWAGSANCYMYDDPLGCAGGACFTYLPWDLDSAFLVPPLDLCPACGTAPETVDADPITFVTGRGPAAKWRLYDLLLQIPAYEDQFVDDVQLVVDRAYDPDVLAARHAATVARIRPSVVADEHVDLARFDAANEELSQFFAQRRAFLDAWLAARP
jgi:hypothetical protein